MAGKWIKNVTGKLKNSGGKKKSGAAKADLKSVAQKTGKLGKRAQVAAKAKKDS